MKKGREGNIGDFGVMKWKGDIILLYSNLKKIISNERIKHIYTSKTLMNWKYIVYIWNKKYIKIANKWVSSNLRRSRIRQTIDKWSSLTLRHRLGPQWTLFKSPRPAWNLSDWPFYNYIFLIADLGTSILSITVLPKFLYYFILL